VGDRRIGLAVGEDALGLARPLRTLRRRSVARDLDALRAVIGSERVEGLVVGLPLTEAGEEGHQARRARRFAEACAGLGVPVTLYDERHTTAEAIARGADDPDAGAATVLLEDFLSRRRR
jgi:putative Holliday junction resolvase